MIWELGGLIKIFNRKLFKFHFFLLGEISLFTDNKSPKPFPSCTSSLFPTFSLSSLRFFFLIKKKQDFEIWKSSYLTNQIRISKNLFIVTTIGLPPPSTATLATLPRSFVSTPSTNQILTSEVQTSEVLIISYFCSYLLTQKVFVEMLRAELRCSKPPQNFNFSWKSIGQLKLSPPKK